MPVEMERCMLIKEMFRRKNKQDIIIDWTLKSEGNGCVKDDSLIN